MLSGGQRQNDVCGGSWALLRRRSFQRALCDHLNDCPHPSAGFAVARGPTPTEIANCSSLNVRTTASFVDESSTLRADGRGRNNPCETFWYWWNVLRWYAAVISFAVDGENGLSRPLHSKFNECSQYGQCLNTVQNQTEKLGEGDVVVGSGPLLSGVPLHSTYISGEASLQTN